MECEEEKHGRYQGALPSHYEQWRVDRPEVDPRLASKLAH